jgi:hypothetical protein
MPFEDAITQLFKGESTIVVSKRNMKWIVEIPDIGAGDTHRGARLRNDDTAARMLGVIGGLNGIPRS